MILVSHKKINQTLIYIYGILHNDKDNKACKCTFFQKKLKNGFSNYLESNFQAESNFSLQIPS